MRETRETVLWTDATVFPSPAPETGSYPGNNAFHVHHVLYILFILRYNYFRYYLIIDSLHSRIELAIAITMLGRADSRAIPAAEWDVDVRCRRGTIQLDDAGPSVDEKVSLPIGRTRKEGRGQPLTNAVAELKRVPPKSRACWTTSTGPKVSSWTTSCSGPSQQTIVGGK